MVGQRVIIDWGFSKGREAVVVDISTEHRGMVTAEYVAKAAEKQLGIEEGEVVKVYLHWSRYKPLERPSRRV